MFSRVQKDFRECNKMKRGNFLSHLTLDMVKGAKLNHPLL